MFDNQVFKSTVLVLLIFLLPALNLSSQTIDYFQMLDHIDADLNAMLQKNCSGERKHLCASVKKFRDGDKVEFKKNISIYLGELYSGDRHFQKTFNYKNSFGLLYVNKNNNKVGVSFEVLITESESELKQVIAYNDSIAKNKVPDKNKLTSFLTKNSRSQIFAKCELIKITYICSRRTKEDSLIFIRYHSGSLYIYSLGKVRRQSNNFDHVHGFHLTEIRYDVKR